MGARMMPGGPVADAVFADLGPRIEKLVANGHTPGLGTLLVGDDEPSARYVAMKQRKAEELGCRAYDIHLPEHATQAEKDVDRAAGWVTEDRPAPGDAAEGQTWGGHECVRVQDAREDDVEKEALDPVLVGGELTVLEIGGDDARVVRAIPALRGRLLDEGGPVVDRGRR